MYRLSTQFRALTNASLTERRQPRNNCDWETFPRNWSLLYFPDGWQKDIFMESGDGTTDCHSFSSLGNCLAITLNPTDHGSAFPATMAKSNDGEEWKWTSMRWMRTNIQVSWALSMWNRWKEKESYYRDEWNRWFLWHFRATSSEYVWDTFDNTNK